MPLSDQSLPATRVSWRGAPRLERETCLVLIYGANLGAKIPIGEDKLSIGRDTANDVVVPMDDVSRFHCLLRKGPDGYAVRDCGSTNGTRVNDQQLVPEQDLPLRSGDLLRVGDVVFKFFDGRNVELLYHEEIHRMAIEDGLTSLYNQRYLQDFLEREMARARRHGSALSLALMDLDHFKRVNDLHGHVAGDDVLREFAALAKSVMRRESCLARYGGEEFAVVLPDSPIEKARQFAERIRETVGAHRFLLDGEEIPVTVSVGVAAFTPDMKRPSELIGAADGCLYEAKQAGRNCIAG
jgi:two-component system cell cycle response regulator